MHERMLRILGGTLVAVTLALGSASLNAQDVIIPVDRGTDVVSLDNDRATVRAAAPVIPPGMSNLRELPAGTKTRRVAADGSALDGAVAGVETLIYSNTRGRVIIPLPPGFLVADDIATIAPDFCQLTKFTFQVMGNENLSIAEDRPYTVTYALYDTCPEAFPTGASPSRLIAGTFGQVTVTENVQDVTEVTVPLPGVSSKTSMWLALTFNRVNCAVIGGAPALEGFSGDLFSFPALGCSPGLGGFPGAPHASFNIELYGNSTSCPCRHVQYRNTREDGGPINLGSNKVLVDDLRLITGNCLLTGYEVALRGAGVYDIELRSGCEGDPPANWSDHQITSAGIPGTYKLKIISNSSSGTRIIRIPVDPPRLISGTVFIAVKVNNPSGGPILTTLQAKIGTTDVELQLMDDTGGCGIAPLPVPSAQGALQATLICNDCALPGACCDMFVKECEGGFHNGEPCRFDVDCEEVGEAPGLCNAPCREVPEINCPFPQRGSLQLPAWVSGGVCDGAEDPFAPQINNANKVCGASACCFKEIDGIEKCVNRFERECDVIGDQTEPRQWQLGLLCGQGNQSCPLIACLGRDGNCKEVHFNPGCDDSGCCTAVCNFDEFCCSFDWDNVCVALALTFGPCNGAPTNDVCERATAIDSFAQSQVTVPADTKFATNTEDDPLVCCHNGLPQECVGGGSAGELCLDNVACSGGGTCGAAAPVGMHSVWYTFVADTTSASIDTCLSVTPAFDSMLSVFRAGDPQDNASSCQSLGLIGCNDDGCAGDPQAFFDTNSKLCVQDLVIGDTYYVMVSTKRTDLDSNNPAGVYDVRFQSPCPDARPLANDFCDFAEPVTDTNCKACTPVTTNLTNATLQCPAPLSILGMESDQWFEYTATCTGAVTMTTCGSGFDTSLLVYDGCDTCPDFETAPIAFNDNSNTCGAGSQASSLGFQAVAGNCYRIRVGDQSGTGTIGNLNISCAGQCPSGTVNWIDPPLNTVDAGRPWLSTDATHTQLGIQNIIVEILPDGVQTGGSATLSACWEVCENDALDGLPVGIQSIVDLGGNQVELTLTRPLTQGAATTFEYLGNQLTQDFTRITTHPGNVDGDFVADPSGDIFKPSDSTDLDNLVIRLRKLTDPTFVLPFPAVQGEPYSLDINRNGTFGPTDLLDLVDLMNGAGEYPVQNQSTVPGSLLCPN